MKQVTKQLNIYSKMEKKEHYGQSHEMEQIGPMGPTRTVMSLFEDFREYLTLLVNIHLKDDNSLL